MGLAAFNRMRREAAMRDARMKQAEAERGNDPENPDSSRPDLVEVIKGVLAEAEAEPERADELLTKAGVPEIAVLKERLGGPVSAAERDAAMKEIETETGAEAE